MTRLLVPAPDGTVLEAARWPGGRNEAYLLLPRGSYEVFLLDVPPVRGDKLEEALPWRIRAFYPGSPDSTRIDHRAMPGDPSRRLVFAADKDELDRLGRTAPGARFLPAALLRPRKPRTGPWRLALRTSAGTEMLRFDGPAFASSRRVGPGPGDSAPLDRALRSALEEEPEVPLVAVFSRDAVDARGGAETLPRVRPDGEILALEDFAARPGAGSCSVFAPPAARRNRVLRVLSRACLAFALILAARAPGRAADIRTARLAEVKAEYEVLKARYSRAARAAAELDRLTARKLELASAYRPAAYRILADLAACAGPGVRVPSLVLEGSDLRVEAEGPDALAHLARMRESGRFKNLELRQSVVLPGRGERYVLTGKARL